MASNGVPLPTNLHHGGHGHHGLSDKRSVKSGRAKRSVNAQPPGMGRSGGGSGGEGGVAGASQQYSHLRGESLRSADYSISSRSVRSAATTSDTLKKTESTGHAHGRGVRTVPTWVVTREGPHDDDKAFQPPVPPPTAARRPPERSAHDAQREATPVTMQRPARESASRWRNFVEVSHPPGTAHSEKIDNDSWLDQSALSQPWLASSSRGGGSRAGIQTSGTDLEANGRGSRSSALRDDDDDFLFLTETKSKRQRSWYKKMQIMLLNSPMVPLAFRAFIWILSLLALAFACTIFQLSQEKDLQQKPSTIMAIVVDALALVYLIYITYDEYSGKPLGLRSPTAKMRLVMMDLVFIVFDSANLSLAFDTLFDTRWSCSVEGEGKWGLDNNICGRQRALSAFLFLALLGWISTFTVSLFRLVERVARSA
ncbi:hypothetical protein BJ508DRAFT_159536 [Ascobolus immersus RN42]|uniref:Regulator of phospholipase D SRF1 n=1 Tax=Ascobolus immersus RN42 TaxID=1160509 RepID=A0A3N4IJS8_ASCIM|nr:hypothetical protein BJ508DRAFT_159536 [Ascobolus immersus RN42]